MNYPPAARVGAWLSTHQYLAALAAAGHEVIVTISERVNAYQIDGVQVDCNQAFMSELAKQADVIVSHLGDDDHGVKVALMYEKPAIRFCHGYPPFGANPIDKYGQPALAVFTSQSMLDSFAYTGNAVVCHPPIKVSDWATVHGEMIGLANNSAEKGGLLFDQLARHMPEYEFLGIKAGHGTRYDMVRPNLTLMDRTWNMRDEFYSRIRILLMPSITETWGMVALEAMCSGIPVIAHPAPGLLESCGTAGIFCLRDDLDAWIETIENLADPKVYARQSAKCVKRAAQVESSDTLQRFVKAVESLI